MQRIVSKFEKVFYISCEGETVCI